MTADGLLALALGAGTEPVAMDQDIEPSHPATGFKDMV